MTHRSRLITRTGLKVGPHFVYSNTIPPLNKSSCSVCTHTADSVRGARWEISSCQNQCCFFFPLLCWSLWVFVWLEAYKGPVRQKSYNLLHSDQRLCFNERVETKWRRESEAYQRQQRGRRRWRRKEGIGQKGEIKCEWWRKTSTFS